MIVREELKNYIDRADYSDEEKRIIIRELNTVLEDYADLKSNVDMLLDKQVDFNAVEIELNNVYHCYAEEDFIDVYMSYAVVSIYDKPNIYLSDDVEYLCPYGCIYTRLTQQDIKDMIEYLKGE